MPELSEVVPAGGRLRREPRQARSRARLAQILAAADAILTEEGVEALTVRRIAERAAVPVGTLYQFFPDKGSVVDAVARAYIAEFDTLIDGLVSSAADETREQIKNTEERILAKMLKSLEENYYKPIQDIRKRVEYLESQNEKLFTMFQGMQANFTKIIDALRRGKVLKK